jgi:hypothetical protein
VNYPLYAIVIQYAYHTVTDLNFLFVNYPLYAIVIKYAYRTVTDLNFLFVNYPLYAIVIQYAYRTVTDICLLLDSLSLTISEKIVGVSLLAGISISLLANICPSAKCTPLVHRSEVLSLKVVKRL